MEEKWRNRFGEWYSDIIEKAEILDVRYPVKGIHVWLPYGFKIRRYVLAIIRNELEKRGHEETLFPLLIPDYELAKEGKHIKGFEDEVYWVTHGGINPLEVKLALRPTSETAIYPMFALWIRSHADFPVKIYQIVNTFRYETKHTRPLIRLREITTFSEAHTCHGSYEEAEAQVKEGVDSYSSIFKALGIPFILSRRPEWDKFPGADYTLAFDTLFPDGRTLQIGTVHQLGQNFAETFEITFENLEGEQEYAYQTCYGMSDRVIAALLSLHGDDSGLSLIPEVAPVQVVIIPVWKKGHIDEVNREIKGIDKELVGYRIHIDNRDKRPGRKYYDWEIKGVPLRLEVGIRDIENQVVTFVRRDTGEKFPVKREELRDKVEEVLEDIRKNLSERAQEYLESRIFKVYSIETVKEVVYNKKGIAKTLWCGRKDCGVDIEERADVDILGILEEEAEGSCIGCGEKAEKQVIMGRSY